MDSLIVTREMRKPGFCMKINDSYWEEIIRVNLQNGLNLDVLPGDEPRLYYMMKRFMQLFTNASKVYLPVHILTLIFRLVKSKQPKRVLLKRFLKEFISSNLFATFFAMSIPFCYCYLKYIVPNTLNTAYGNLVSFLFSWAILLESKGRWGEISIYVLAQWFEGFTHSLYKRKLLPVIPGWEKFIMAISMAIVSWVYFERNKDEQYRSSKVDVALQFVLGDHHMK